MSPNNWPKLGCGLGLRTTHYESITKHWPKNVDWFEAISENYMDTGGRPLEILEKIRTHYPVALHGVSLSIGSTDPLNRNYLKKLKLLARRIEPAIVSDHLCWTGVDGKNLHDLLPLPYTEEAAKHIIRRVRQVQDFLERKILLENVSTYFTYKHSRMQEWDFLTLVAEKSGCGILLDVNNVYVNAYNHGFDAYDYLKAVPREWVGQFHLAGHTNMGEFLFDTHSKRVIDKVWDLYRFAVAKFGQVSTLVEWDEDIPDFEKLSQELERARKIYGTAFTGDAVGESYSARSSNASYERAWKSPDGGRTRECRDRENISLPQLQKRMKESVLPSEKAEKAKKIFGKNLNRQGKAPGEKRIAVYADGYLARMHEALVETYPAVRRILGEENFLAATRGYAEAFPSEEYSLSRAGRHFPAHMAKTAQAKKLPFLPDLAKLEWLITESFHAFHKRPVDFQNLRELSPEDWENVVFGFQPSVSLIVSKWPILDIWNARNKAPGKIRIDLINRPQHVLLSKQEKVQCELVDQNQFRLLKRLMNGKTIGQAMEIFSENERTEGLPLTPWFAGWARRALITSCHISPKKKAGVL